MKKKRLEAEFAAIEAAGGAPREPTSDAREFARWTYDYFTALVAEGFTRAEALDLVGRLVAGEAE